jgi:hypothetical protein
LIFEFKRADVFHVSQGPIQIRFAAIDPVSGEVGTENIPFDHRLYLRLAQRCHAELSGGTPIFSVPATRTSSVPSNEACFSFGVSTPAGAPEPDAPPAPTADTAPPEPDSVLRMLARNGESSGEA